MKKLVFIFLFIVHSAVAQHMPDYGLNRVRITDADRTLLIETLPVTSGPKVSPFRSYFWYSANVVHSTQGGFSGKLLNGAYHEFYINKNLKEEGSFKSGLKDGLWKNWSETGVLLQAIKWKNGIRNGKFSLFDDQGKLTRTGTYKDDLYQGKIRSFEKDSVSTTIYSKGKVVNKNIPFFKRLNIFKKKSGKKSLIN
jgi:hypothetical protein